MIWRTTDIYTGTQHSIAYDSRRDNSPVYAYGIIATRCGRVVLAVEVDDKMKPRQQCRHRACRDALRSD